MALGLSGPKVKKNQITISSMLYVDASITSYHKVNNTSPYS